MPSDVECQKLYISLQPQRGGIYVEMWVKYGPSPVGAAFVETLLSKTRQNQDLQDFGIYGMREDM